MEVPGLAVLAIGDLGIPRQIGFVAIVTDKPDAGDETRDHPDRERAAAEAEAVDPVAVPVVVDVDDIALQANAENSAQDRQRLERRGAYAVVVIGDLPRPFGQIERLKQPPDIGPESFAELLPIPSDNRTMFFDMDAPAPDAVKTGRWRGIATGARRNQRVHQKTGAFGALGAAHDARPAVAADNN